MMAIEIRGSVAAPAFLHVGRLPAPGDLIIMEWREGDRVAPGWTRIRTANMDAVWRWATGTEAPFPRPAVWYSGVASIEDDNGGIVAAR